MGDDTARILHFEPPPTKVTRVRPQLSCIPCRQGKLKCNRQHPACDQCVKRSREAHCTYVPPPPKDRTRKAKDMRGRIRHLESLVVDLMNGKDPRALALNPQDPQQSSSRRLPTPDQPSPEHPTASDGPKTHSSSGDDDLSFPSAFGALKISDEETTYMGGSHWMTVLNDIKEVKSFLALEEEDEQESEKPESEQDTELPHRHTLIVGSPKPLSKRELLQNLPPKADVDRLVLLYLRGGDPTSVMFHEPSFRLEYERHWQNPSAAPTIWIALMYGILCLSSIFSLRVPTSGMHPQSPEAVLKQAAKYHDLCASAAVLGDFSRPKPWSLETVMLYAAAEFLSGSRGGGSPTDVWHIFGTVIRIALRMGYHRDPSHYGISPFHGEMRRRTWYLIYGLDVLLGFSLGMPSIARGFQSDTRLPRNLHSEDLSPDMTDLPPERPDSELTIILYTIAKAKLLSVFAPAADAAHSVTPPTYPEIMDLDQKLEEIHSEMPLAYKMKPLEESAGETPDVIMNRLNLELLYQKTRCVLHRTYLAKAHNDSRYEHSRKACLEASLALLELQAMIYRACQPGGLLVRCSWYYGSLTSHDFLLAAMLLCLEINLNREKRMQDSESYCEGPFSCAEMFRALENATHIWDSYGDNLIDANDTKKAARAFRHILAKLKATPAEFGMQQERVNGEMPQQFTTLPQQYSQPPVVPSNGPGIAYLPAQTAAPVATQGYSVAPVEPIPLEGMLEMPPFDINWDVWDKSVLPYDEYMQHEPQQWPVPQQPPNIGGPSGYPPGYLHGMPYPYQHQ
ncbi:c6 transcription factor [Diplodia corticola]|uniref:C6 transcription factor n=1 Tax=Diplodia corticola TaxID=236234 RepID=A0A1J9R5C4_9PEZI|nr:c6 transcription factor [Diplodia corticola]OJD35753.1 c6 transcription factor [Diplodia corticola]